MVNLTNHGANPYGDSPNPHGGPWIIHGAFLFAMVEAHHGPNRHGAPCQPMVKPALWWSSPWCTRSHHGGSCTMVFIAMAGNCLSMVVKAPWWILSCPRVEVSNDFSEIICNFKTTKDRVLAKAPWCLASKFWSGKPWVRTCRENWPCVWRHDTQYTIGQCTTPWCTEPWGGPP